MYVYELYDHNLGRVIGIYASQVAAMNKVEELTKKPYDGTKPCRFKVWPTFVRDVIYEEEIDCMYQEDPREREYDFDYTDVNAVPF